MPAYDDDPSISNFARQRDLLESTLRDLRSSLYHWRRWEAEYDGLKSALVAATTTTPTTRQQRRDDDEEGQEQRQQHGGQDDEEDMLAAALEYISVPASSSGAEDGDDFAKSVLTPAEVDDIIYGTRQGNTASKSGGGRKPRSRAQILSLLDRRIDYVSENERVLERRVERAERDLDAFMDKDKDDDDDDDKKGERVPVTEIVEELDEADSVVRGDTVRAGESAMELLDMLKRAGVKEVDGGGSITEQGEECKDEENRALNTAIPAPTEQVTMTRTEVSNVPTNGSTRHTMQDEEREDDSHDKTHNGIVAAEFDESPEDAALRREMVQYGLDEVGSVVAELELDESGSEVSVNEESDYMMGDEEDEEDEEEDEDEEDEYGRTTRRVIGDDYHKQMLELERKLNARGLQNIGPDTNGLPTGVQEDLRAGGESTSTKVVEQRRETDGGKKSKKPKKRVAFAEDVDIAPDTSSAAQAEAQKERPVEPPAVTPIQEQVVERAQQDDRANGDVSEAAKPAKKVSRFRSARQAQESTTPVPTFTSASTTTPTNPRTQQQQQQYQPASSSSANNDIPLFPATPAEPKPFSQPITYPDDPSSSSPSIPSKKQPLSDTLVERPPPSSASPQAAESARAPDPDDFDETMLGRQVKTEYYRIRNRKIQQEGGFVRNPDDDDEENGEETFVPIDDDQQSGRNKVSRFKAARVKNNAFS